MTPTRQPPNLANHILSTSSNLLGICFVIFSFIKVNGLGPGTVLDESLIIPILLFFAASIFSYFSMRSEERESRLEAMADRIFIIGLFSLMLLSLIFIFEILV